MPRSSLHVLRFAPLALFALACSDSPTAPPTPQPITPQAAERTILAPFILPAGADWGHYFVSFDRDRSLDVDVIHYPDGHATGQGLFAIPLVGIGSLKVTGATADASQGCVPESSPCPGANGTPEGSDSFGVAIVNGHVGGFTLHFTSNHWPNPTNTFDVATLTLCFATCSAPIDFHGELHHEP